MADPEITPHSSDKKSIITTIVLTLLLGSSTPFWWDKVFPPDAPDVELVADAGNDTTINFPSNRIILDARLSRGTITSYQWGKRDGPKAGQIMEPGQEKTTVENMASGQYKFLLTVTDRKGRQDSTIKIVFVTNGPDSRTGGLVERSVTDEVAFIGNWGESKEEDNEMDTKAGKVWMARCNTTFENVNQTSILLTIRYRVNEGGGNKTAFDGINKKIVFKAPAFKKIKKLVGDNTASFEEHESGPNNGFKRFRNNAGTYWEYLMFRVDGQGRDDHKVIGIRGKYKFTVILEDR